MADVLYSFYLKAADIGGVKARTRLSVLTKITSIQASSMPDDPETVKMFEDCMKIIVKEFEGQSSSLTGKTKDTYTDESTGNVNYLRKHISIFSDLTAQRSLFLGSLEATCKRITESIVDAIDIERASIWLYDEGRTLIECYDLFIRSSREHQKGYKLMARDYPKYFASIQSERTLSANDAHTDPRTCEFSDSYLKPLGINSMLDIPIWADGKMVGVVCHEHVGPMRKWTKDEENFAYLMGNIVAIAIEAQKTKKLESV
ncbi:MAG: GAF domain-containing protein [Cytophagaceae bacterium]|nr:GAF domain-containing protein [Cytophagaceae bacterium]MDW8455269.1 GAF domain-containing protein [Cytophagaceae bacterium]